MAKLKHDHSSSVHRGAIPNKPGGRSNWVEKQGGLPAYIARVAKHIAGDSNLPPGRAIAAAVSQCRKWAAQGNAEAAAAVAEWERMKAASKAKRGRKTSLAVHRAGAVDLASYRAGNSRQHREGSGYEWKHGYIPLTAKTAKANRKKFRPELVGKPKGETTPAKPAAKAAPKTGPRTTTINGKTVEVVSTTAKTRYKKGDAFPLGGTMWEITSDDVVKGTDGKPAYQVKERLTGRLRIAEVRGANKLITQEKQRAAEQEQRVWRSKETGKKYTPEEHVADVAASKRRVAEEKAARDLEEERFKLSPQEKAKHTRMETKAKKRRIVEERALESLAKMGRERASTAKAAPKTPKSETAPKRAPVLRTAEDDRAHQAEQRFEQAKTDYQTAYRRDQAASKLYNEQRTEENRIAAVKAHQEHEQAAKEMRQAETAMIAARATARKTATPEGKRDHDMDREFRKIAIREGWGVDMKNGAYTYSAMHRGSSAHGSVKVKDGKYHYSVTDNQGKTFTGETTSIYEAFQSVVQGKRVTTTVPKTPKPETAPKSAPATAAAVRPGTTFYMTSKKWTVVAAPSEGERDYQVRDAQGKTDTFHASIVEQLHREQTALKKAAAAERKAAREALRNPPEPEPVKPRKLYRVTLPEGWKDANARHNDATLPISPMRELGSRRARVEEEPDREGLYAWRIYHTGGHFTEKSGRAKTPNAAIKAANTALEKLAERDRIPLHERRRRR